MRGETKGLWLHGMHPRSAFRPRSKQLSGMRLEDSLNPLEDSSFAMSAARSKLPEDLALTSLSGAVGTSPRKGTVWNRQAEDFTDFMNTVIEMMELVEEAATSDHLLLSRPFPVLAEESHDLSEVWGAFDIVTMTPEEIPTRTDVSDEVIDAAAILERATLRVIPIPESPDFLLDVGLDGSLGGRLRATVRMKGDRVAFSFGIDGTPTHPDPVGQVRDALKEDDLFVVYYDSGHVVGPHGIGRRNVSPIPFDNWRFHDFSDFCIDVEKPDRSNDPAKIHALTGDSEDTSLFSWVVKHYSRGWLICDDGPGEVADFVHIGEDDTLRLIHVKKAGNATPSREVAASTFEVVAS